MAVGLNELPPLAAIDGIRLGTVSAGIKKPGRRDLVVVALEEGSATAGVFTRNAFCAAPVQLARAHLAAAAPRLWLINAGNANAGTGEAGLADARRCCQALADLDGLPLESVLPFSTGVIGERLPVAAMQRALPEAYGALSADGWAEAAHGIMTTDTVPKAVSRQVELDGRTLTFTGMVKGAGMIRPDMATLLAFIGTDAAVAPEVLQQALQRAVQPSFNHIIVDGDTSTNDACVVAATGRAGNARIERADGPAFEAFQAALTEICEYLAQAVVRDAEGATKFVTVEVAGGATAAECDQVAFTVAHSPLVKTALFASDPNWGRILAAVGRAGLADLEVRRINIFLDSVCIVRGGGRADDYTEEQGQAVMDRAEITIRVELGRGAAESRVWTSDLSHEYVRINAEYRT